MLKYNSVNINLAANHINMYILLGLFTLLAIIQWVLIQKKKSNMHKMVVQKQMPPKYPLNLSNLKRGDDYRCFPISLLFICFNLSASFTFISYK